MNQSEKKLEADDTAVVGKDQFVRISNADGGIFCFFCHEQSFAAIVNVHARDFAGAKIKVAGLLDRWSHEYKFEMSELEVKYLLPKGMDVILNDILDGRSVKNLRGKEYNSGDKLDVVFEGVDGRLRVAGVSEAPEVKLMPSKSKKIKVIIVDDSKTVRKILSKVISELEGFEVVAMAEKPSLVERLIKEHDPDVMTLDINMPEMDGVELLKRILPDCFIPTVLVSSVNAAESTKVIEALDVGAVDYIHKPGFGEIGQLKETIEEKLRVAAALRRPQKIQPRKIRRQSSVSGKVDYSKVICIGSSTGGTEAVRRVLEGVSGDLPPILITQHIPAVFSAAFAQRLNEVTPFRVREAQDGDVIGKGEALVAPGGKQMAIESLKGGKVRVRVYDGEKVSGHAPSVNVLFTSAAEVARSNAIGLIMTGMGKDGADGMLKMKNAGSHNIAQSEETCVVYGMPKAAVHLGAHSEICALEDIGVALEESARGKKIEQAS